jgi:hypothetical protein
MHEVILHQLTVEVEFPPLNCKCKLETGDFSNHYSGERISDGFGLSSHLTGQWKRKKGSRTTRRMMS